MKIHLILSAALLISAGCKTTARRESSNVLEDSVAQGTTAQNCDLAPKALRAFQYANANIKISFFDENTGAYLDFRSPGNQGAMPLTVKYGVTNGGFRCLITLRFVEVNRPEQQFYVDADFNQIANREETVVLKRTERPAPMQQIGGTPQSQGTSVRCGDVAKALRTYQYENADLEIFFLDEKQAVFHDLRSPGNQGTIPLVVPFSISPDGFRCVLSINNNEFFIDGDLARMMNRSETVILNRASYPASMNQLSQQVPSPTGSNPLRCGDVQLGLRGYRYGNIDLEIIFLSEKKAVYHSFRSPGSQGTVPAIVSYQVVNAGVTCMIAINGAEYFPEADLSVLTNRDASVKLLRLEEPSPAR